MICTFLCEKAFLTHMWEAIANLVEFKTLCELPLAML